MDIIKNDIIEQKIIEIRGNKVMLDSDVAELYGVETRAINQAVSRNLEKFPMGYLLELTSIEWSHLKSQFVISNRGGKVKLPIAFTERGLYMLATILKTPRASATTIAIIEAFIKIREIQSAVLDAVKQVKADKEPTKAIQKVGKLVSDLIIPDNDSLETIEITDEIEFKFMGVLKLNRTVVKKPKSN